MTGKELTYLVFQTQVKNKTLAEKIGMSQQAFSMLKISKNLQESTVERIFDGFAKLGFTNGEIQQLLKQRFEESKAQPPTPASDRQTNALIRLSDLQYQINQQKRHIDALELNVKLLTEKLNGNG
jgi:hypothetical protein